MTVGPPGDTAPTTGRAVLLRLLRRNRGRLLGSMGLLSMWQLCEALVPVFIGIIIDRAITDLDGRDMVIWGVGLLALFLVLSNGYRFGARLGFEVLQREAHSLRLEIAGHALRPQGARSSSVTGEVLSLATADAEKVGGLARSIGYAVASACSAIFTVVVLLRADLVVGLVVIVGVLVTLALIQLISPVIARRSSEQQERIAHASGLATDLIRGVRVLRGIGAEDTAIHRYRSRSRVARDASIRTATSHASMQGLTVGLSGVFLAVVGLTAGQRALQGSISVGELVAVVGLAQFLAEPLRGLGHVGAQIATAYASATRISDFLATPALLSDGPDDVVLGSGIGLAAVTTSALHGLDVDVAAGTLVGVVVDDPVGAAHLVEVAAGERIPDSGSLRLAGTDLDVLSIAARRTALLVVPHRTDLFAGTLRANIDLTGSLSTDRLEAVVSASAVSDVVGLHPEGLDQPVTAGATTFSGGQQQRIALARALAADAPILLLHEPTSAVDAVTEQHIADGIRAVRHADGAVPRTTLVLSSSPAILGRADRVVIIRGGVVVADGSPDEVRSGTHYRELVLR